MKYLLAALACFATKVATQYVPPGGSFGQGTNLPTFNDNGASQGSQFPAVNVPTFPNANLFELGQLGSTSAVQTNQLTTNIINQGRNELSTPVRSIPSLFTRFPSRAELDKFADDGDVGGITKTLQVVAADDSVPCGTKIAYLL